MGNRSILYELNIQLDSGAWGVSCPLDQNLIGPVGYGWDRFQKDPDSFVFGGGLLAGSPLPGTRRMIFCAYSPQWEGFYVSALGGAMYVFHRVGVNYVWMRGTCPTPSVVVIRLKAGEYSVRVEPFDAQAAWDGYTDAAGRTWEGFYGLQHAVFDRYKGEYDGDGLRVLATGPAAAVTREGAIGSNQVRRGELSRIDDWAGRGGLGSRLYQHHNVAAVVFGGDWQDPALKEARELDQYFLDHFGQRAIASDLALSQKYRYVPEFETGGTFGVNMHTADAGLLSFNYTSIYASDQARLDQHQAFVKEHYLQQFNAECIQTKNFDHCGEPCAVACKKFTGEFKKDYEPYEALGPNSGIFDQRAAEMLNKFVDSMGLDSIQAGGTAAWVMELVANGLIPAADFGLPADGPRFTFVSDPAQFRLEEDSLHNARYAVQVLRMILFTPQGAVFRRGLRAAAKALDQRYAIRSIDRAVYTAHGQEGCMVPNQYWVPGMFAPMPLMGKYFSFYEGKFYPPYELGKKNAERFVYELYSENSGACRFHRKWIEDIIDEITLTHFDLNLDFWQMNFTLAKGIHDFQSAASAPWESERVVDLVASFLEKWQRDGLKDPALLGWIEQFRADKWAAARKFWDEMYAGMAAAFQGGLTEPAHKAHGPIAPAK
jgi:glyceraldehyde-3-phosphate dehydrogenase (ferredoxin)